MASLHHPDCSDMASKRRVENRGRNEGNKGPRDQGDKKAVKRPAGMATGERVWLGDFVRVMCDGWRREEVDKYGYR